MSLLNILQAEKRLHYETYTRVQNIPNIAS